MKLKKTLCLWLLAASMGTSPLLSAQDRENPVDDVGANHNQALDCLMKDGGPADASAFERLVTVCGYDPGEPVDAFVERNKPLLELDYQLPIAKHMDAFRDNYTAEEFDYFRKLDVVLETSEDAKQGKIALAALEQEALSKLDLKSSSARSVLGALSTARHSLAYWETREGDVGAAGIWTPWRWRLFWVVRADIIGWCYTGFWGPSAVISYYYWWWLWWWWWWW
jgi:hypothetical protein